MQALAVSGWARYLSATEVLHNNESLRVSGEDFILKLEGQSGVRTRDLRLFK